MRKLVLASAMAAGLTAPALAQMDGSWTYISLVDGTVAWDAKDTYRHPDGKITVKVMLYRNDPAALPAGAEHTANSSGPAQAFDFENYFAMYSCSGNAVAYEGGMFFSIKDGQVIHVADTPARPPEAATAKIDNAIRDHICGGVKPAGAGEAKSVSELINAAVALEKRTRGQQ